MADPLLNPSVVPNVDIEDKAPRLRRAERHPEETVIPDDRLPEDDKADEPSPDARANDLAPPPAGLPNK